jgi:hypothetical protein
VIGFQHERRGEKMFILKIEHPVPDYAGWKKAFDDDPAGRKKSGVRRYRILRPVDNPNYVMIDLASDLDACPGHNHVGPEGAYRRGGGNGRALTTCGLERSRSDHNWAVIDFKIPSPPRTPLPGALTCATKG